MAEARGSACVCGLGRCVALFAQRLCRYADDTAGLHEHDGSIGLQGRLAREFGGTLQRRQGRRQEWVFGLGDVFGAHVFLYGRLPFAKINRAVF